MHPRFIFIIIDLIFKKLIYMSQTLNLNHNSNIK
jgi:hypothetical protein